MQLKHRLGAEHLDHLLGVGVVVGGAVNEPAWREASRQQVDERRLHQPPLVMTRLWPRVWKVDARPCKGRRGRRAHR